MIDIMLTITDLKQNHYSLKNEILNILSDKKPNQKTAIPLKKMVCDSSVIGIVL